MSCHCHLPIADVPQMIFPETNPPSLAALQAWQESIGPQPSCSMPKRELPPDPADIATAAELCTACRIRLKPLAKTLLDEHDTPQEFYRALRQHDCLADARRILAHALPKRRALWWGCLVSSDLNRHEPVSAIEQVLPDVIQYVTRPNEASRRLALEMGKRVGVNTLAGTLAMATFFSAGSVSLPGLPEVPPRPFVTGRLIGVTVYLASVMRDAAHYKDHLRAYLDIGELVAQGQLLWHAEHAVQPPDTIRRDHQHGLPMPHCREPVTQYVNHQPMADLPSPTPAG